MNQPSIDAVYTWVDGGDPAHIDKINKALVALGFRPRSAAATRFASHGEIFQSLRSLDRFAPFFRYIHIVTDNQRPDFESQALKRCRPSTAAASKPCCTGFPV
jgi:Stealth protein CR1, conserved region 1